MSHIRPLPAGTLWALSCAWLLAACATSTAVPDRINVTNANLGSDRIKVVDVRPLGARGSRMIETGGTYRFLADSSISPDLLELLSSRLADVVPLSYHNIRIEVLRLDVGLWKDSVNAPRIDQSAFLPPHAAPRWER
jgi:hypothetical protein